MRVLVAAIAVLTLGCGSSRGPDKVRIALVANAHAYLPVMLASKLGFYREEGIDAIEPLPST